MAEEKLYELRKDAQMPNGYWRAGHAKTKAEWEKVFGPLSFMWSEWFIDKSKLESNSPEIDVLGNFIDTVFERKGLHSMTYKEAAREIALLYAKTLNDARSE